MYIGIILFAMTHWLETYFGPPMPYGVKQLGAYLVRVMACRLFNTKIFGPIVSVENPVSKYRQQNNVSLSGLDVAHGIMHIIFTVRCVIIFLADWD